MNNTLYIGSDHAGFDLKHHLVQALKDNYEVIDCGAVEYVKGDDYPEFAKIVCEKILADNSARGILACDTGVGMSIAANRFSGIRAAMVTTRFMAERSREHNNANILCLGQDVISREENTELVKIWLSTDFSADERHIRRLEMLDRLG